MRLRHWTLVLALATAAVASSGCVVTVQESSNRGDGRLRNEGWEKLGQRMVNGKADRDRIVVGRSEGRFRRVVIVVENSSLEMYDMDIEFTDGSRYSPKLRHKFAKNSRSQVIDLPGGARTIRSVTFKYGNLRGGGAARIELWGR